METGLQPVVENCSVHELELVYNFYVDENENEFNKTEDSL